jgi:phage terminase large subunit
MIKISDKILPSFFEMWKACDNKDILNIVCKGGRNSSKSTTISIRLIFNRMKYKSHALIIRKIDKSLRRSCREQLIWAIKHLNVEHFWDYSLTPLGDMTLTYKPTNTKIFFEGANNPEKIKSYKTNDLPITDIWFEELEEFKQEDEINTITNSILRSKLNAGLNYKFFYSYNPPKRKQNWINKKYESINQPNYTFIHYSSYLQNKYVSDFFKIEAEHIKNTNLKRYEWEYLGLPIGGGILPFNNLQFKTITDKEIENFDNIRQGIDWGYANDPFCFVRLYYDKTKKIIYVFDEIYQIKLSNKDATRKILNKKYNDITIIADSSEPKSIDELKSYGIKICGAKKGPGSVEYGEKWLDELEAIVIDYKRTPNVAKEFEEIDYEVDRDGNIKSKLEDKNNHAIDSIRYALSNDMDTKQAIYFI